MAPKKLTKKSSRRPAARSRASTPAIAGARIPSRTSPGGNPFARTPKGIPEKAGARGISRSAKTPDTRRAAPALSHLNHQGHAHMVDVGEKNTTHRVAVASAIVEVGAEVLRLIAKGQMPKGDVFAVARIAGIAAAKRTAELIPLCHPLPLESIQVELAAVPPAVVRITSTATITAKTGVEMEALTAAAVAALTLYDMCKSANKAIRIGPIQLESKTGGKSGAYHRARSRS